MEVKEATEINSTGPIIDPISAFQPVLTIGKIVGLIRWDISPNGERCSLKKFLCWFQFVFVQIIVWGIVFKYVLVIYLEINSGRLIPILAIVCFQGGAAYVATLTYVSSTKNLRQLFKLLNKYQAKFEPFQKMGLLKKHVKANIYFHSFNGVSNTVLFSVLVGVLYKEEMTRLMFPFHFSDVQNSIIAFMFLGSSQLFTIFHFNVMFVLSIAMSYLLIAEFKHVTKKLKNGIEDFNGAELKDANHFEQFLEKTRQQHNLLVEILEATNSLVKHFLFVFFALAIPMICFVLYGVIRDYLGLGEIIFCFMMSVSFVIIVSTFSIVGAHLNFKAHEPFEVLMFLDLSSISDKTYRTISIFNSNLTGTKIGYRIYDLLTIDASALLNIIGTFVTYAVVMLQFTAEGTDAGP